MFNVTLAMSLFRLDPHINKNSTNEMVSTGDTEISLHIRASWNWEGEGGTLDQLKLKVPRSAQIFIGGHSRPTFLDYLSEGTKKFWTKNSTNWYV